MCEFKSGARGAESSRVEQKNERSCVEHVSRRMPREERTNVASKVGAVVGVSVR
jgi:hypothetical protein